MNYRGSMQRAASRETGGMSAVSHAAALSVRCQKMRHHPGPIHVSLLQSFSRVKRVKQLPHTLGWPAQVPNKNNVENKNPV